MTTHDEREAPRGTGTPLIVRLVAAWCLVGIPLAWGVWQVVLKSLDLFR